MFNRRQHGPRRIGNPTFPCEIGVLCLQLANLSLGAPLPVAVPRISEVGRGDPLEATPGIKAPCELVVERLVVNEPVLARRSDGAFVEALGLQLPPLVASDLGADQQGAILEIRGTALLRPFHELSVVDV